MRTPVLVITSERWTKFPYVVFDDDNFEDIYPADWLSNAFQEALENGGPTDRETLLSDAEDEFYQDNTDVSEFDADTHLLHAGGYIYRYDDDGTVELIDEE
jgi:hypothetical protein